MPVKIEKGNLSTAHFHRISANLIAGRYSPAPASSSDLHNKIKE